MLNPEAAQQIVKKIMLYSQADQTEVIIQNYSKSLTRYANNVITQNVHENEIMEVTIRVIKDGKTARMTTTQVDDDSLKKVLRQAMVLLKNQKKDPKILSLASKQKYQPLDTYVERTAKFSPLKRAQAIRNAVVECTQNNLKGSGIFSNSNTVLAIANSKKLFNYHRATEANFTLTAIGPDSNGWAGETNKDVDRIDTREIAKRAIEKALKSKDPVSLPAGQYTVILEPAAAVEFLLFMAFQGFGALLYQEGRSFLSGKLGKKLMGDNISIVDDVYHPQNLGMPFDFEGLPRQKVSLIENGVAKRVVYDRLTAKKAKKQSTGHALPQPNTHGPLPTNLILMPGDSSLKEMIASTKKGVLVTEFHYTNIIDPMKMTLTGMTRNGTFLIENGTISRGIKNMRFTESVLKALSNVELLSKDLKLCNSFFGGGFVTPSLKINNFNFSSGTKF